jgi:transcriptional regulator with XRE-family HTH domain
MSDDKATLTMAERIRVGRAEKKWTQRQLAEASGLRQEQISQWERGITAPVGRNLDKLFAALGVVHSLDAVDGVLGIQGRALGKLKVIDPMAPPVPVEWLIEGFVARGFLTMIAGQPGAGKSMVTQTFAAALVEGAQHIAGFALRPRHTYLPCQDAATFCDPQEDKWHRCIHCDTYLRSLNDDDPLRKHTDYCEAPCRDDQADDGDCEHGKEQEPAHWHRRNDTRALVIDAENGENLIQERAQNQGLTEGDAPRYIVAASDGFDIYKDRAVLDSTLADYRDREEPVDLLVIDSFTSLWFGNENVVEQVMGVLKYLNELAKKYALGVLLIHHTDKDGESYRGSSAIAATIGGGVFAFSRYDDKDGEDITARQLVCQKMRIAAEPERRKLYVTGHGISDQPATSEDNIARAVADRDRFITVPSATAGKVTVHDFPEDEWVSEDGQTTWTRQEWLDKLSWEGSVTDMVGWGGAKCFPPSLRDMARTIERREFAGGQV